MGVLFVLGFAGGLPFLLTGTGRALQAWLKTSGASPTMIGLFGLVALPYSLKVLWAPWVDRYLPPLLGRRRGWLMLTQLLLVGAIALLGSRDPAYLQHLTLASEDVCTQSGAWRGLCELGQSFTALLPSPFFQVALLVAFLSATQDIAADAYRTDVLKPAELGGGAAVFVTGYRIALVIVGGAALALADPNNPWHLSWPQVYGLVAAMMGLGIVATLIAPEPQSLGQPTSIKAAIVQPFREFFQRLGLRSALAALGFVVLYRYGDALLNIMATPFLLEAGYSQSSIGFIQGVWGIGATIVGTLAGGSVFGLIGVNRSLWVFGILQALSNVAYWILASSAKSEILLWGALLTENFCSGLATAGFLGFMMSLCHPRFSATQFALLSSLMAVSRDLLAAPAGKVAELLGWPSFFLLTIGAAVPGLLLLPLFAPWRGSVGVSQPLEQDDTR
jgi:PAT family beta-lactamase induction signal transducer AmpG